VADLPWVDDSHPGLPQFSSTDDAEILATVLEERRRELYLQGMKMGDDIRTDNVDTWDTGVSLVNAPIGDLTCLPVPELEFL
jgi:hypothetical protein